LVQDDGTGRRSLDELEMGIRNIAAALAIAPDKLTTQARLTLVTMAYVAYDDARGGKEPRLYHGGWRLAMTRQGLWPTEAMKKRFIRNIAELRELGLVEIESPARHGRNAVYRLILPVDNLPFSGDNEDDSGETEYWGVRYHGP
jgi:hypothetical protein